jgi:hypothetical protein
VTLAEILAAAAASLDVVAEPMPGGGTDWRSGETVFASLDADGRVASFRLDAVLAAAAQRTPDTGPSGHGPAWVTFAPTVIDGHAVDRATAWFLAAARRAGG